MNGECIYIVYMGIKSPMMLEAAYCLGEESSYNYHSIMNSFRQLHWTEDCRLSDVVDGVFFSHYGYDSEGTRWLKMVGRSSVSVVNGAPPNCMASLSEVTLYASPYLVATNTGYTKHYYAGTERVAARVGNGGLGYSMGLTGENSALTGNANRLFAGCLTSMGQRSIVDESPSDYVALCDNYYQLFGAWLRPVPSSMNTSGVSASTGTFVSTMGTLIQQSQTSEAAFYYHSDHLGGAAWITDGTGQPVQHLQYYPFGEPFVNQRATGSTYSERYTFTGKERDSETGYSDFGARYMDHALLTSFMSVDPLTDKYPNISPYAYCAWNPVKLVDPDGKIVKTIDKATQRNILYSLSKKESRYIRFNKDGTLNDKRLQRCKSLSTNITALKALSKSKTVYEFSTSDNYTDANGTYEFVQHDEKIKGVTLIPNNTMDPSPDDKVHVVTYKGLSEEEQVNNIAHEGYGHAYFYELNNQGEDVKPNHEWGNELIGLKWNDEFNKNMPVMGRIDKNEKLSRQIKKAVEEASKNYLKWKE